MTIEADDPRGLIREAYRIEGISPAECRSIFLDWALSLPDGTDLAAAATRLLADAPMPDHPMSTILDAAQSTVPRATRRGGRGGRRQG